MAFYKIYYLDFCYQNRSFIASKQPVKLQNAILRADFLKKVILGLLGPLQAITSRRGTFKKMNRAEGWQSESRKCNSCGSSNAQQHVDQSGHVTDADAAVTIDIGGR